MTASLPLSRLVQTAVNLSPQAASTQNLSTLLILGTSDVIDAQTRLREYDDIETVARDFGTAAPEYLAALLWFEQLPQPRSVLIGRWLKTASAAQLLGSVFVDEKQTLAALKKITAGELNMSIDGKEQKLTALDFSACQNLNAVAEIISSALKGLAKALWDASNNQFNITSTTTGAQSTISFAKSSAVKADENLAQLLGLNDKAASAQIVAGFNAESALEAVSYFANYWGQRWYGLTVLAADDNDHLALAPFIEVASTKHVYGVTSQATNILIEGDEDNIAAKLKALKLNKSIVHYSSTNAYAVVSLLARILTTNYGENNSTLTLMYKQAPGIVAETLSIRQVDALEAKHCNVFVAYNNDTAIIEKGQCASGEFIDTIIGIDNLALSLQTALFNLLYTSPTKVPQTDSGMHGLAATAESVCARFVNNGFLSPGIWQSNGFGNLKRGDLLDKGFYVYVAPVASQSTDDRKARKSMPLQIAVKLAGAVHTIDLSINVNS